MVSATCRYSSWERAYQDYGEEDSIADSLSRIFAESIEEDSDLDEKESFEAGRAGKVVTKARE